MQMLGRVGFGPVDMLEVDIGGAIEFLAHQKLCVHLRQQSFLNDNLGDSQQGFGLLQQRLAAETTVAIAGLLLKAIAQARPGADLG